MADFIREVDEDYRRDKTIAFWKTYGWMFLVGAGLIILAVSGYTFYQSKKQAAIESQANSYLEAELLIDKGNLDAAIMRLEAMLTQELSAGYNALAQLRIGQLHAQSGDRNAALAAYEAAAKDTALPQTFRDLAQISATSLQLDRLTSEDVIARLSALTLDSDYKYTASELIGVSLLREGKQAEALPYFRTLQQAQEAPQSLRGRAQTLLTALDDAALPDVSEALDEGAAPASDAGLDADPAANGAALEGEAGETPQ